jgi:type IV pilus assembly protein PilB
MTQEPADEKRIGDLLIRDRIISEEELQQAVMVQRNQPMYKPLGEVCMDLGFISRTKLRTMLDKYRKRIRLGDLLLNMGKISEMTLMNALVMQQESRGKLGQILLMKSSITQPSLTNALGVQLTIPTMTPDTNLIDKNLLKEVSANFLYRRKVIPVSRNEKEGVVTVIMNDPLDHETIIDLEKIFRVGIEPAILTRGEIDIILDSLLDTWFNASDGHVV